MGLLDWLTDSLGGPMSGGGATAGESIPQPIAPPGMSSPPPTLPDSRPNLPPMPPNAGSAAADITSAGAGGAGAGAPPIPLPMPRPQTAAAPPPTPLMPPPGAPGPGTADAVASYQRAGGTFAPPGEQGGGPTVPSGNLSIIGRALGLDANRDKELRGSLATGLKSVGDNWNKPGLAAFAGTAGSAMGGGNAAQDKTIEQQQKYLTQAISAAKVGDERAANQALTKLRLAQADMTRQGKGGKDSVVNSDQQLYLRAQGITNQDQNLKILKSQYDKAAVEFGSNSPQAKAALEAHQKAYTDTLNGHLTTLGLDPKKAEKMGKQPGFSQDNPIGKEKMNSQKAFNDLPPGSWFTNPKDGRVLQKPLAAGGQPGGQAVPNQGTMPGLPPPVPQTQTDTAQQPATADEQD